MATSDGTGRGVARSLLQNAALEDFSGHLDAPGQDLRRLAACGEAIRALSIYCGQAANDLPTELVSAQLHQAYRMFSEARDSFSSEDFATYFLASLHQVVQNDAAAPGIRAGAERYLAASVGRLSPDIARLAVHVTQRPDAQEPEPVSQVRPGDQPRERLRHAVDKAAARGAKIAIEEPRAHRGGGDVTRFPAAAAGPVTRTEAIDPERGWMSERAHASRRRADIQRQLKMARDIRGLRVGFVVLAIGFMVNVILLYAFRN